MRRFDEKVVIVTGSDSGIGQNILLGFAKEGASIVVHGIDDGLIDETVDLLKNAKVDESKILKIKGFFDDDFVLKKLIEETIAKFGRLDILVNNAGVFKKPGTDHFKESYSNENIDFVFKINTRAPFILTELALPYLEKTKGCIINTCSAAGFDMNGKQTYFIAYATTKAALLTFTKFQAVRCDPLGVRVNAVCPGVHESPFTTRPFNYLATEEDRIRYNAHKTRVCNRIPVGDYGQIPDLVQTYLNLAASKHITGAIWIQDGGRLNWAPESEYLP